jgi:hypothetical protein
MIYSVATVAITITDKVDKCAESSPGRAMNENANDKQGLESESGVDAQLPLHRGISG